MSKPSLDPKALSTISLEELRDVWRQTLSAPPPAHSSRDLLIRSLVYRAETKRSATSVRGLRTRLLQIAASFANDSDYTPPAASGLRPGAVLVRDWNGKRYAVTVTSDGFLLDDKQYDSLSAVAQAITGAKWSGPRFFRLHAIAEMKEP